MSIPAAYIGVVFIWSTTPLATQWSTTSLSPMEACALRLCLAALLMMAVTPVLRIPALDLRRNWRLYAAASIGLFPNLPLLNAAAQHISSGLISVLFGLAPFVVSLLAAWLLGERLCARHYAALALALSGLLCIFADQLSLGREALLGVGLMLLSVLAFSVSSVLVKYYGSSTEPIRQLNGSLLFSLPGTLLCWWLLDGEFPHAVSVKSGSAVLYLALVGSLAGVGAYFYLLRHMSVNSVALIPLITPGFALLLGSRLNGEPVSSSLMLGAALILTGLALFNRVPA